MVSAYKKFEGNFAPSECKEKRVLQTMVSSAAITYFTGFAVRTIGLSTKGKAEKRTSLQSGLENLQLFGGSETELDQILKTNVDKHMRV